MHQAGEIFRALADPTRRAIFERLSRRDATSVKDLVGAFDVSQPAVSQHLAALRGAGLVKARRDGRVTYYRVEPKGLRPLFRWIDHYRAFWTEKLPQLGRLLEEIE